MIHSIIDKLFDNINLKIADFIGDFAQKTCIFCMGGGYVFAHSSTICFYYTTINFFCQVFYTTFLELFLFFLRFQRAPCAAPRFPFTLQGRWLGFAVPILALSKKGISLLSFRPIAPHIRDILFSLLLCRRFTRLGLWFIIFGSFLYRFW